MSDRYREGLRHGYEDMAQFVQDVLDQDLPDAGKLDKIAGLVAPHTSGAVTEQPGTAWERHDDPEQQP